MKAISVKQPLATLLALGEKRFETRHHRLNIQPGDWVAIQASKTWRPDQVAWMKADPMMSVLNNWGITWATATHDQLPRGTVVAVARCQSVVTTEDALQGLMEAGMGQEVAFGDYGPGRWAFYFDTIFRPADNFIHVNGKLGLWQLPEPVEHRLLVALQHQELPDELTSDDLVSEALVRAERIRREREDAGQALDILHGVKKRAVDRRLPIERLIDQAVGNG